MATTYSFFLIKIVNQIKDEEALKTSKKPFPVWLAQIKYRIQTIKLKIRSILSWKYYGSYSASDIQDDIKYATKPKAILTTNPLNHIYINRINNRLALKRKDGYKLPLQMPETKKFFGSTKKN